MQIDYDIIAFAPLPAGWYNVFRLPEGGYEIEPCPGVLTVRNTGCDPQEVEVYFAGHDGAYIQPLSDAEIGYVCTIGPGQGFSKLTGKSIQPMTSGE